MSDNIVVWEVTWSPLARTAYRAYTACKTGEVGDWDSLGVQEQSAWIAAVRQTMLASAIGVDEASGDEALWVGWLASELAVDTTGMRGRVKRDDATGYVGLFRTSSVSETGISESDTDGVHDGSD